jgi:hypothetical protein
LARPELPINTTVRIFSGTETVINDGIFIAALLAAIAYARWHYWWKTGFGRGRMSLILSIAAIMLEPAARSWADLRPGSLPDKFLNWAGFAGRAAVLLWMAYFVYSIVTLNIRHALHPGDAASLGRRHLERTPWASREQIEKLTACWDEIHGGRRGKLPGPGSLSRVRPA